MDAKFEELQFELAQALHAELSVTGAREVRGLLREMNTIILRRDRSHQRMYLRSIVSAIDSAVESVLDDHDEEKRWREENKLNRACSMMSV